ncbi:hypothetical protein METBIDRAFT_29699 [Metschnikowia bicuspidata var. bicuspidata NRRL YB-4993]|uniref:Uncharacterized protein n=1 Tax=Metschnikowia bicuspidata var. bicuspidata NRRL YB-4993 TaxID=869754 RepID=A0A1A0HGP6_9ASCO|nr:hypothetical protein METBIDRAFT_29699 [Metschnikowia bicuspidata var. bicuspidata NRRL YB-4993]OBA23171.1 hypothetical protein METBIDRAFT_29699 [Metschnikowia bicuspidata var. bicuspidata NRRL YB-4993]
MGGMVFLDVNNWVLAARSPRRVDQTRRGRHWRKNIKKAGLADRGISAVGGLSVALVPVCTSHGGNLFGCKIWGTPDTWNPVVLVL